MLFEIRDIGLANALGHFAYTCIKDSNPPGATFRIDLGDTVNEESRIRIGINDTPISFSFADEEFELVRNRVGPHCASHHHNIETAIPETVLLTAPSSEAAEKLCQTALLQDEALSRTGHFRLYVWDAPGEHWRRRAYVPKREWDSVVMDDTISDSMKRDLSDFSSDDVKVWYRQHGIHYRRGYLFHGPPGTGKTSMIAALASYLERPVYKINLVAPKLTDDSLHDAITSVREGSIIVFEDIDCLYGSMREKKEDFFVTFSGLLNAIDGLADAKGTLFIFTSNHPDRLDHALRRKGRIDMEFEFGFANEKQAQKMFLRFFPECDKEAAQFAKSVSTRRVSPATLQEHFVQCRNKTAQEAAVLTVEERKSTDALMYN